MLVVRAKEQVSEYGAALYHRDRLIQLGILRVINPHLLQITTACTDENHRVLVVGVSSYTGHAVSAVGQQG